MPRFHRFRVLREYARSFFGRRPPEDASEPAFRGRPVFVEEGCVSCGACAAVCPSGAIRIVEPESPEVSGTDSPEHRADEDKKRSASMRRIELAYDRCHFCGRCEEACITKRGIRFQPEDALSLFDRRLAVESVEKEVTSCGRCGALIAAADQLRWVRDRLGFLAYGNPLLVTVDETECASEGSFRPLCSRCRLELSLRG